MSGSSAKKLEEPQVCAFSLSRLYWGRSRGGREDITTPEENVALRAQMDLYIFSLLKLEQRERERERENFRVTIHCPNLDCGGSDGHNADTQAKL